MVPVCPSGIWFQNPFLYHGDFFGAVSKGFPPSPGWHVKWTARPWCFRTVTVTQCLRGLILWLQRGLGHRWLMVAGLVAPRMDCSMLNMGKVTLMFESFAIDLPNCGPSYQHLWWITRCVARCGCSFQLPQRVMIWPHVVGWHGALSMILQTSTASSHGSPWLVLVSGLSSLFQPKFMSECVFFKGNNYPTMNHSWTKL
jgi:hypothetical protein